MNWAKSDPAYNSDSKLFFFSFVAFASGQMTSYPLAVIRTQQQAQGNIYICFLHGYVFPERTEILFSSPSFVCFTAFSSDSRPASGILQGLIGIYQRRGIRGYYNGMGASFFRAVPCALINYTLTKKFENLFSSVES